MRLVVHIGMGKTGTTAIQGALAGAEGELVAQNARYLGMWFDLVDPRFAGHAGLEAFASATAGEQKAHAATFAKALKVIAKLDGTRLFLLSNEGLFGMGRRLAPFFKALCRRIDVTFVAYVRPVRAWLPSAFTQWGIRHKAYPGPIAGFGTVGRRLVGQYGGVRQWSSRFSGELTVRPFDKGMDVVEDFARTAGVALGAPGPRLLERPEPAETLLRALFNDRFEEPVLPERFSAAVMRGRAPRRVSEMAELCFGRGGMDEVVAERAELFDEIREITGLDLAAPLPAGEAPLDPEALRERLIDHLIEIVLQQSLRIERLERRMDAPPAEAEDGA